MTSELLYSKIPFYLLLYDGWQRIKPVKLIILIMYKFFGVIGLKTNLYLNQLNLTIYLNLFTFVMTMQLTITEFNYFI